MLSLQYTVIIIVVSTSILVMRFRSRWESTYFTMTFHRIVKHSATEAAALFAPYKAFLLFIVEVGVHRFVSCGHLIYNHIPMPAPVIYKSVVSGLERHIKQSGHVIRVFASGVVYRHPRCQYMAGKSICFFFVLIGYSSVP